MDINKVTLIGRLTRKPEERTTAGGQKLASFTIATNYLWRDYKTKEKKDKTEFHTVAVWGKLAEICIAYLDKGSRVYIEGRIQYREWIGKDGKKRKTSEIIADEVILLSPRGTASKKSDDAFVKEEPTLRETVVAED